MARALDPDENFSSFANAKELLLQIKRVSSLSHTHPDHKDPYDEIVEKLLLFKKMRLAKPEDEKAKLSAAAYILHECTPAMKLTRWQMDLGMAGYRGWNHTDEDKVEIVRQKIMNWLDNPQSKNHHAR